MKLYHISRSGKQTDLNELCIRITWSGDNSQAARKIDVSLVVSPLDTNIPRPYLSLGEMLKLTDDSGAELFRGYIFHKGKSLSGTELSVTAYDGLIYLTKSKLAKKFRKLSPEAVTKLVCTELGVPVGKLAETGIEVSFIHMDKTGYETIMTAYTSAAKHKNADKAEKDYVLYMPRMREGKLDVIVKGALAAKMPLTASRDLTEASYAEDIESMVNKVLITNEKGEVVGSVEESGWVTNYGLLQSTYRQEEGKDAKAMAKVLLSDVARSADVQLVGGPGTYDLIAGNSVLIEESYTGLTGRFYIDSDTHTFENNQHSISLQLKYKNTMDEFEAEQEQEKAAPSPGGKSGAPSAPRPKPSAGGDSGGSRPRPVNLINQASREYVQYIDMQPGSQYELEAPASAGLAVMVIDTNSRAAVQDWGGFGHRYIFTEGKRLTAMVKVMNPGLPEAGFRHATMYKVR